MHPAACVVCRRRMGPASRRRRGAPSLLPLARSLSHRRDAGVLVKLELRQAAAAPAASGPAVVARLLQPHGAACRRQRAAQLGTGGRDWGRRACGHLCMAYLSSPVRGVSYDAPPATVAAVMSHTSSPAHRPNMDPPAAAGVQAQCILASGVIKLGPRAHDGESWHSGAGCHADPV
jgi:hypothetical protein